MLKRENRISRAIMVAFGAVTAISASTSATAQLEEIVVVAQKRAESLQDVPIAVTAFTGETMKLGVRSSVKGLSPLKFEPDFFNCTKSPMTSSTLAVSYT